MSNPASLKERLQEKEELVAALTERLEMAAEQLDRLRRTGAGRGGGSGGGFPAELIERHEALAEDLQRAVGQWEDMQAAAVLGRLELQVEELRDLIVSEVIGRETGPSNLPSARQSAAASTGHREQHDAGAQQESDSPDATDADSPDGSKQTATDGQSHWDTVKAALLGDDADAAESTHTHDAPATDAAASEDGVGTAEAADRPPVQPEEPIGAVEPPLPVDFEAADETMLWKAIEDRDEYITYLIKKLRSAGSAPRLPANWDDLGGVPEELRRRVEELQNRLDETLRMSEVELSLERARLGREESRLRQLEDNIQKTMRQLGRESGGGDDLESGEQPGSGSRWLRMLGIGAGGDAEDD